MVVRGDEGGVPVAPTSALGLVGIRVGVGVRVCVGIGRRIDVGAGTSTLR